MNTFVSRKAFQGIKENPVKDRNESQLIDLGVLRPAEDITFGLCSANNDGSSRISKPSKPL